MRERYSHAREDAQQLGLIPTLPEVALASERVDPATQSAPELPALDRKAMRGNWDTSQAEIEKVFGRLLKIIESETSNDTEAIASARAIMHAHFRQWEQDNPDLAGKMRAQKQPQQITINIGMVAAAVEEIEKKLGRRIGLPPAMQQIEDAAQVLPEDLNRSE